MGFLSSANVDGIFWIPPEAIFMIALCCKTSYSWINEERGIKNGNAKN